MPQFKFNTISRTDIESSVGGAQMIAGIDYDGPYNIIITGSPGSGKTTVSLMRAERLVNQGKAVLLITFQDLLRRSLINIASEKLATQIHTFMRWYWQRFKFLNPADTPDDMLKAMVHWQGVDEIIIDEGQDLESRVFEVLITKCKKMTVGADNAQKVHEKGINSSQIKAVLSAKGNEPLPITLMYNYRNTFGIYDFARHFLPFNQIVNNKLSIGHIPKGKGERPTVFLVPDNNTREAQLKILLLNAKDRNVAVLVYLKDEVEYYAKLITEMGIPCSKHHHDDHIGNSIENVLVTTFKSAKGLEFEVVIMPNLETLKNKHYKTSEHYFVACTRAKESLYVLILGSQIPSEMANFQKETYILNKVERMAAPKKVTLKDDEFELPF